MSRNFPMNGMAAQKLWRRERQYFLCEIGEYLAYHSIKRAGKSPTLSDVLACRAAYAYR